MYQRGWGATIKRSPPHLTATLADYGIFDDKPGTGIETQIRDRDEKFPTRMAGKKALDEELKRLRAEVASTIQPDTHDYSEVQTRNIFIFLFFVHFDAFPLICVYTVRKEYQCILGCEKNLTFLILLKK